MSELSQFRFQKHLRLARRSDFQRVYKQGHRARSIHFTVFFLVNQLPYSRFGLTVTKKLGSAVRRNRVKRIFREALRLHLKNALTGFDYVFNPHLSAVTLKATQVEKDLGRMFAQLKEKYDAPTAVKRD
jgi:ribonuclease P protein component